MRKREEDIHIKQSAYFERVVAVGDLLLARCEEGSQKQSQIYRNSRPFEFGTFCYRPDCGRVLIGSPRELLIHLRRAHGEHHIWFCYLCELPFERINDLQNHQGAVHGTVPWCSDRHFSTKIMQEGDVPRRWDSSAENLTNSNYQLIG